MWKYTWIRVKKCIFLILFSRGSPKHSLLRWTSWRTHRQCVQWPSIPLERSTLSAPTQKPWESVRTPKHWPPGRNQTQVQTLWYSYRMIDYLWKHTRLIDDGFTEKRCSGFIKHRKHRKKVPNLTWKWQYGGVSKYTQYWQGKPGFILFFIFFACYFKMLEVPTYSANKITWRIICWRQYQNVVRRRKNRTFKKKKRKKKIRKALGIFWGILVEGILT